MEGNPSIIWLLGVGGCWKASWELWEPVNPCLRMYLARCKYSN